MNDEAHPIVDDAAWLEARMRLLAREKELTRLGDELAAARRALPWRRVRKDYRFQRRRGEASLADLFDGRSQLLVYHFMFAPDWDRGCKSCSFWADGFERMVVHLANRDVTMLAVSRAPLPTLDAWAKRLGWTFEWASSQGSDFNHDFAVSFTDAQVKSGEAVYNYGSSRAYQSDMPGVSVFHRDAGGEVLHTYSAYSRGIDRLNAGFQYLDLVPKGRNEQGQPPMAWLRVRDEYAAR
jgi:predicted dithiol-disulfide oxidoreductase (DUF899 family)